MVCFCKVKYLIKSFRCSQIILMQVLTSTQRRNFLRSTTARESCLEYINSVFALSFCSLSALNHRPKKWNYMLQQRVQHIFRYLYDLFRVFFKNSLLTILNNKELFSSYNLLISILNVDKYTWFNSYFLHKEHECPLGFKGMKKNHVSYFLNYSVYLGLESIYLDNIKSLSATLRLPLLNRKVVL